MHIVFFNRSFYPDTGATGQLLTELCEDLVQKFGCRVSVVAGRAPGPCLRREQYKGIEIYRAWGTRFSKRTFLGRFSNYVTYFISSCWIALRINRPDLAVALTDPPVIGLAAYLASRRFRVPLVISYRDIFPEAGRLLEDFRSPIVDGILQRVNCFLVRRADRVIALGETMRRRLIEGKGADPARTVVIPDWADCQEITPGPKENPFSKTHGLVDKFVVMHSGNMGLSQGLETLLRAAQRLGDYSDLQFIFVGDGVKRSAIEQQAKELGLSNVRFLPHQPKENLRDSFASADCFIISLKPGLAGTIVPSKLYGILASGRPYVAAVEEGCEAATITRRYDCGLLAEPGNPEDLAQKILTVYHNRALGQRLGTNGRKAALRFDRSAGIQAYYDLCCALAKDERPN
jgi:glycosyltransferase involved in cell wall biosynthesis